MIGISICIFRETLARLGILVLLMVMFVVTTLSLVIDPIIYLFNMIYNIYNNKESDN